MIWIHESLAPRDSRRGSGPPPAVWTGPSGAWGVRVGGGADVGATAPPCRRGEGKRTTIKDFHLVLLQVFCKFL